jgi:hypothetical protein
VSRADALISQQMARRIGGGSEASPKGETVSSLCDFHPLEKQ